MAERKVESIPIHFHNSPIKFCPEMFSPDSPDKSFKDSGIYCVFEHKIILAGSGKTIGNVFKCKVCHFMTPNPVISFCSKSDDFPNDCSCEDSPILCKDHPLNRISKINKNCIIDVKSEERNKHLIVCKECKLSFTTHVEKECTEIFKFTSLVCKNTSGYFEDLNFYVSSDIIHRYNFWTGNQ